MPRTSASAKRQQGPSNHRDTRHENGLVGPGKRISKQKSQNHLSPSTDSTSPPPVPSTPPTVNGIKTPDDVPAESLRRGSLDGFSESSSSDSFSAANLGGHGQEENHRRIDVNASKNSNVHRDPGPFDFALTVLRSCPLQDTIAILIILMQIPPLALSGIYMLFAVLTFVNTSTGLTLSEVFEWNLGAPSLATVVCVDGIVLLIWLFLWGPIQHVILDLAQMVIALGLGGGSSSKEGGSVKNTMICLSMILLSHILRHQKMHNSTIGYLLGSGRLVTPDLDDPLEALESMRGYDRVRSGWANWVRSVLAIHILTQGLVKCIRDWYLRRERRDNLAQATDPEAGKPFTGDFNDGGFSTPDSDATSLQPPVSLHTKKKRKHSLQIRMSQPLWAAIASTKIVVVKEYELNHSTADSAGSNATDIHNLGNAPFNTEPDQIWISYVGCDEVCFNTSHFPGHESAPGVSENDSSNRIDLSKPFYVRVNNAIWQPTRITAIKASDGDETSRATTWSGYIYGLTPTSNYECEFVSSTTHEVLFSTSVRTTQAKTADVDAAAPVPNGQRSLRPDSPTTTLKTSIAAAEIKLGEEKSRHKALRKEWHRKANAIKKENEKLSAAVQSAGAGDDKLRQKVQQNSTQQKQAEQAIAILEAELKDLEIIPESLKAVWRSKQSAFNEDKTRYDKAHCEFKSFKATVDNQVKSLIDEKASLEAKRNKISSRIAKVDGEHARIADANARGLDEAERRRQDRATFESNIVGFEREFLDRVNSIESRSNEKDQVLAALRAQLEAFHNEQQSVFYNGSYEYVDPATMSQLPPGSTGPNSASVALYDPNSAWSNSAYNASMWGQSPLAPGVIPQSSPLSHFHSTMKRGRSSSMLSDVSGFTQSSTNDDELISALPGSSPHGHLGSRPPGLVYPSQLRNDAEFAGFESASGSGSRSAGSSGSGSAHDPMSPPPTTSAL